MSPKWLKKLTFAKVTVGFAVLFVVSAGMCGMQMTLRGIGNSGLDRLLGVAALFEALVMLVAILGLLICVTIWAVVAIFFRE